MIPEEYYKLYPYNLAKHMFDDIARIRNLGPKSFSEVMDKLSNIGFMASNGTDIYPIKNFIDYFSDDTLVWIADME